MKDITVLRKESKESDRNTQRSRVRDAIECIVTDEGATERPTHASLARFG